MIFRSKYTNRKFFNNNNRDFYDAGYHAGLTYREELKDKVITTEDLLKSAEKRVVKNDSWFKPVLLTLTFALLISLALFLFGDEKVGAGLLGMVSLFLFLTLFFKNEISRAFP